MSCLRTFGRIVSEFARLILFVASIVFLLSSLLLLAFTYQSRRDFEYAQVENINTSLTVLVGLSIYLIVLAVLGIFASFFSSKGTIKLLACMLILNVIVGITVLATSNSKFDGAHKELERKFGEYQIKYDWDHNQNSSEDIRGATQAWDNLQADSHCCGLQSPDDWAKYRPATVGEHLLPISCCQLKDPETEVAFANASGQYCDRKTEKYFESGCSGEMKNAFSAILYMIFGLVCFCLLLGILAVLVICCRPSSTRYDEY